MHFHKEFAERKAFFIKRLRGKMFFQYLSSFVTKKKKKKKITQKTNLLKKKNTTKKKKI